MEKITTQEIVGIESALGVTLGDPKLRCRCPKEEFGVRNLDGAYIGEVSVDHNDPEVWSFTVDSLTDAIKELLAKEGDSA